MPVVMMTSDDFAAGRGRVWLCGRRYGRGGLRGRGRGRGRDPERPGGGGGRGGPRDRRRAAAAGECLDRDVRAGGDGDGAAAAAAKHGVCGEAPALPPRRRALGEAPGAGRGADADGARQRGGGAEAPGAAACPQ